MANAGSASRDRKSAKKQANQRAAPRNAMLFHADIRKLPDGEATRLRVRNLSEGGLMADCTSGFVEGDGVAIDVRGVGLIEGRVAWATGDRIGVAFAVQIDPMETRRAFAEASSPLLAGERRLTDYRPADPAPDADATPADR